MNADLTAELGRMMDATTPGMRALLKRLARGVLELEARLDRWRKAVEGLTPGGSEFYDDPERCAQFIKRASYMELTKQVSQLEAQLAAKDRALNNARLLASLQFNRANKAENFEAITAWGHILRFCREVGCVGSVLREGSPDAGATDTEPLADHTLIATLMCRRLLRWEPFGGSGGRGELCFDGLRYCTELDQFGVPALFPMLRDRIIKAGIIAKAEKRTEPTAQRGEQDAN